ncbi:MAG: anaerobic ribonucleoside-triphosphate reductase [Acutalibacteraceae bacterium]|nr:anaerobic ribonucleoside-triphosphate reductase [Acutalibacteraceae bacterium]
MKIVKRDGKEVEFDITKIIIAITKANADVPEKERISKHLINAIAEGIKTDCESFETSQTVEQIQDMVESYLMKYGAAMVAREYIRYRYKRELVRDKNTTDDIILSIVDYQNEDVKEENSNKNPEIIPTQRDYIAGEVSRDVARRLILPSDVRKAHDDGLIHVHDTDYYLGRSTNCCLVNLEDMLQNGTVISETMIEKPHKFSTACTITSQIIAQVSSSQWGGVSVSIAHLAPFVEETRRNMRKKYDNMKNMMTVDSYNTLIEKMTKEDVVAGVQTMQYQVQTLLTTNGQAPFVTFFMYLNEAKSEKEKEDLAMVIEEILKQRYQGVKNEQGAWVSPAFPKLIYVLEEDNIHENSKYWYLTELAAKCSAKRLVPDYISEKKMKELKVDKTGQGQCYAVMGCRSSLSPDFTPDYNMANAGNWEKGKGKYYGRFNIGVVTINLVDVACSAYGDMDKFWKIFDERLELCHKALKCRIQRMKNTPSDVAPILWQHGALARLKKGEYIDKLFYDGYATISLGYAGLYECVYRMTGKSHTDPEATPFALEVMKYMNKKCEEWKQDENIGYSIYGSPIENTTYKFAKCLKKRFGIIENVTDHTYITNSYHVNVREDIDAFEKLAFEAQFQELSSGGMISYIETPNLQHNIPAILSILKFIYETTMYAELNTKSDYCSVCGYDGEMEIVENEDGKLDWRCPNCGNMDKHTLSIVRRTCGYLGSQRWSQGRTAEIRDRVLHLN